MGFGGRAQATQIGFVLLLGILVAAFSMYQSTIIPNQNQGVEFTHNQRVQKQMLDLRNNMLGVNINSIAKGSVLEMAPQYQTRLIGFNPREPAGRLYTIGTENQDIDVGFRGAQLAQGFSRSGPYNTGVIVYAPDYNEYPTAPETVYDQTTVYNKHRDGISRLTDQALLNGETINIVHFESTINRVTTRTAAIDVKFEGGDSYSIEADGNLRLVFSSYAPPEAWEFLEYTEVNVDEGAVSGGPQPDTQADIYRIEIDLDDDEIYSVEETKVVVESRIP